MLPGRVRIATDPDVVEQDTYHVGDMVYILAEAEQNNSKAPISTWAAKVLEIRGANAVCANQQESLPRHTDNL